MAKTNNKGNSPHRTKRQNNTKTKAQMQMDQRYCTSGTNLSSLQVESIIEDRLSTKSLSFQVEEDSEGFYDIEAEFWPQRDAVTVSLMDIAQPAKGKDTKMLNNVTSSSNVRVQAEDATTFLEDFEVWEDDIYERSTWDDDWEEIHDDERGHTRRSYSSVLQGKDG